MTMLEKVARAIHGSHGILLPFDHLSDDKKYGLMVQAHAAISAMREPTSAMLRPQVQKLIQSSDVAGIPGAATYEGATIAVADIWQSMIDAALGEGIVQAERCGDADLPQRLRIAANNLVTGKNLAAAALLCTDAADALERLDKALSEK